MRLSDTVSIAILVAPLTGDHHRCKPPADPALLILRFTLLLHVCSKEVVTATTGDDVILDANAMLAGQSVAMDLHLTHIVRPT